jgi:hypothetical protein
MYLDVNKSTTGWFVPVAEAAAPEQAAPVKQ